MYISTAQTYAQQSTCLKRQVGCVVVKDEEVIAYGFNHGYVEECTCSLESKNPNVLHAEAMALQGHCRDYMGAHIYITHPPCNNWQELIKQKQIKAVTYINRSGHVETYTLY
mgnify:FL=1